MSEELQTELAETRTRLAALATTNEQLRKAVDAALGRIATMEKEAEELKAKLATTEKQRDVFRDNFRHQQRQHEKAVEARKFIEDGKPLEPATKLGATVSSDA